ncbi:oligosaccharide flippase family protein [Polymorphobacter sp. PAMC 29334]|uniref:lipopolysaccharide biosynthesis protein n=1 Tax=Polymorphobacter sp. PAMC 29334 TaxID=2862331 RepID=UPI001C7796E8|nr:oligosaccharide flippase family protein [Polymorphobacter sp. PAMC 29334]QYE35954.1 oligosaccharide flippase family protein [Polymorphobacter sp. PAMC 29334]
MLATVFGRGLSGGLALVVTPVYIRLLGTEAYGLFGFYLVLFATAMFLDHAVSSTIIRALARPPSNDDERQVYNDTLRTGEALSIGTALIVGAAIIGFAPWLARTMIHAGSLPHDQVADGIRLIGLVTAAQWPTMLYSGALTGLGRLVELSLVRGAVAVVQWLGGAGLLWLVSPRIEVLLAWQGACVFLLAILLRYMIHRSMPRSKAPPRFSKQVVATSWRFGLGAMTIAVTGTILTQADKLLVSSSLPVTTFVAYSLAFTVASVTSVFIVAPAMSVAFPHFTRLYATADDLRLGNEYRRWTQLTIVFLAPATCVLVLAPASLLNAWLGARSTMSAEIAAYLPWIALGTMINAVMLLPFNLQLAAGWTLLSSIKNLLLLPIFLLTIVIGIPRYGAIVGAEAWLALNLSYYIVEVYCMHRRLLKNHLLRWWGIDTLLPVAASFAIFELLHTRFTPSSSSIIELLRSAVIALIVTIALIAALPYPRAIASDLFSRARFARAQRRLD